MTMFCDRDIIAAIHEKDIEVHPFDESRVQPASIDFTLGRVFYRFLDRDHTQRVNAQRIIDPKQDQRRSFQRIDLKENDCIRVEPGVLLLGCTAEYVGFGRTVAGRLEGKSSLARLGLAIHVTAGFFDPGFRGFPTLELVAHAPIKLYPGMPIAQMSFFRLSGVPRHLYGDESLHSKYQDQPAEPVLSRYHLNFDQEDPQHAGG